MVEGGGGSGKCWEQAEAAGEALSTGQKKHSGTGSGPAPHNSAPSSRIRVHSSARTRFHVQGSPAWEMQFSGKKQIGGSTCKHCDVSNEELRVNALISLRLTFCLWHARIVPVPCWSLGVMTPLAAHGAPQVLHVCCFSALPSLFTNRIHHADVTTNTSILICLHFLVGTGIRNAPPPPPLSLPFFLHTGLTLPWASAPPPCLRAGCPLRLSPLLRHNFPKGRVLSLSWYMNAHLIVTNTETWNARFWSCREYVYPVVISPL